MYAGLSIYICQIQRGLSVDFPALDGYGADGEEVKVQEMRKEEDSKRAQYPC